jgi:hypothetical protein
MSGEVRAFNEAVYEDFIRIRMIATWQAEETMERAVSERRNPSTFLA